MVTVVVIEIFLIDTLGTVSESQNYTSALEKSEYETSSPKNLRVKRKSAAP